MFCLTRQYHYYTYKIPYTKNLFEQITKLNNCLMFSTFTVHSHGWPRYTQALPKRQLFENQSPRKLTIFWFDLEDLTTNP